MLKRVNQQRVNDFLMTIWTDVFQYRYNIICFYNL